LAAFKYPRRVSIVAELPKSATGKVLKWRLASL
jgi:acyl-coenzyme A synthetase/AMP-(fatty) acid ligase